ncbi:MAG: mechanosensitive ion channel family protein [Candidatus Magnetomorum sp.]|nr:mechanosensitive ion channel family protein [Candidatus Magnetomorum sp.]
MKSYYLIISDIIVFVLMYILAQALSAIFPGTIEESTTSKGNVRFIESRRSFKHVMVSVYVLLFSFVLLSIINVMENTAWISELSENIKFILTCEERYVDAWMIFWFFALFIYLSEYIIRSWYNRREKTLPVSRLLMSIIRSIIFYGMILWILHFVLKWNPTHLVVSTTVIIAIGGYSLNGLTKDLLAGIFLHMTRAVLPSDWIYIPSSGLEGEVLSTNWRETRLRTSGGHVYILHNSYLTTQIFHNLSWPNSIRNHTLSFILNFKSSPDDIEKALLKAANDHPDVMKSPNPPQVSIKCFLEYGIQYELEVWSKKYYSRSSFEGQIYRSAWHEFQQMGIKLPRVLWVYMGHQKAVP